ncbi:unnamed protein product [Rhizopus stolonifer]
MKTELYSYQKNSLLKIIEKERNPKIVLKDELVPFQSLESTPYLNRMTGCLSDEPDYTQNIRGVIICENMLFCHARWICTGTPTQHLTDRLHESDDLKRLEQLLTQIGLEPFSSHPRLWHKYITQPFLMRAPWALRQCDQILKRTLIRHQPADIQREVALPSLYQMIVYLEFDRYQWLAHNCQIAMISLNAILSQREGPNYLFSAKNIKSLRETVHNLW